MAEFKYGLVYRPPGLGAVPKGYVHYDPSNQGIDGVRHGVLTYDHELTPKEVKDFELKPLTGGAGLHKLPEAVQRKAKEAIEQLNYIAEEHITREDAPEAYEDCEKVLEIFRKYAKSKGLDANECLKELGLNAQFLVHSSMAKSIKRYPVMSANDITYELYCSTIDTLDPSVQTAFSIPGPLGALMDHLKELTHELVDGLKIGIKDVIVALKQKDIFALLKGIGFNLKVLVNAFVKLAHAGPKLLIETLKSLEEEGWLDKIKSGAAKVDDVLHAHPILTKVGGVVIAALLLYLWINASFTGHPNTDLNMTSIVMALKGHFDVADLFADPEGLTGVILSISGMAGLNTGISWLGHLVQDSADVVTALNLCLALVYTGLAHAGKMGIANKIKPYLFGKKDLEKTVSTVLLIQARLGDNYA
jgi:hypothetical protein